jgi:hypothetical protein
VDKVLPLEAGCVVTLVCSGVGSLKTPDDDPANDLQIAADRASTDSLCGRWYLQYSLSLRDIEELLEERGLEAVF